MTNEQRLEIYYEGLAIDKVKEGIKKVGTAYNNGMNKSSEYLAKKIVKSPKDGASSSEYAKYKKKLARWKATIKIGEFLATGAIALGPFDWALKALTMIGIKDSREPGDRVIKSKIKPAMDAISNTKKKLGNQLSSFKQKLKSKQVTESQFKKEVSLLDTLASTGTKQCDVIKSKQGITPATVKESSFDLDIEYDDNGEISYEMFEYVNELVDYTDFTDGDDVLLLESYIDVLMKSLQ